MQISPDGGTLAYSTFLGGEETDRAYGLAVDPSGNIVLTGLTFSSDFPLKNPAQTWPGNENQQNAFVAKFAFTFSEAVPAMNWWSALLSFLSIAGVSLWKMRRGHSSSSGL